MERKDCNSKSHPPNYKYVAPIRRALVTTGQDNVIAYIKNWQVKRVDDICGINKFSYRCHLHHVHLYLLHLKISSGTFKR